MCRPKSSLMVPRPRACVYRNAAVPSVRGAGSENRDLLRYVFRGEPSDDNSKPDGSKLEARIVPASMFARFTAPFQPLFRGKVPPKPSGVPLK